MIVAELQLHWVERVIGVYLVATNSDRPESGAIWEKGRKTRSARSAVERLASDREAYQRMARNAGNLSEIVGSLASGQGAMLSAEHFRELYQKLPQGLAAEHDIPLRSAASGERGALEPHLSRKGIRRAHGVPAGAEQPRPAAVQGGRSAPGAAGAQEPTRQARPWNKCRASRGGSTPPTGFSPPWPPWRKTSAAALVPQPERLLEVSGQIARVGLSDEALAGFVDIGFEVRTGSQSRVLLLQGQDWAVWRLRSLLEGKSPAARPGKNPLEGISPQ